VWQINKTEISFENAADLLSPLLPLTRARLQGEGGGRRHRLLRRSSA
jgi:hypothetical protein